MSSGQSDATTSESLTSFQTGSEIEFLLLDDDYNLISGAETVEQLEEDLDFFTHEFGVYQGEIGTDVETSLTDHEEQIRTSLAEVDERIDDNMNIAMVATYPFETEDGPEVYPTDRLLTIVEDTNEEYGFETGNGVELQTLVQSNQINISPDRNFESKEELFNKGLRPLFEASVQIIPHTVALSSNSAYFNGEEAQNVDTGEQLFNPRRHIWIRGEGYDDDRCGIPPEIEDLEHYRQVLKDVGGMGDSGIESSIYWDVRFRTEDKQGEEYDIDEWRIEYRPMDVSPTVAENLANSAFALGSIRAVIDGELNLDRDREQVRDLTEETLKQGMSAETPDYDNLEEEIEEMVPVVEEYMTQDELEYWKNHGSFYNGVRSHEQQEKGPEKFVDEIVSELDEEIRA